MAGRVHRRLTVVAAVVALGAAGVGLTDGTSRPAIGSSLADPGTGAVAVAGAVTVADPVSTEPVTDAAPDGVPGESLLDQLATAMAAEGLTFDGDGATQDELLQRLAAWHEGSREDADVGTLAIAEPGGTALPSPTDRDPSGQRAGGVINPVPGARLFDSFGLPRSGGRLHKGIDIFAPEGTPVVAARGGVVIQVRGPGARPEGELGGRTVTIAGDDGRFYYYAHHSENLVVEGDRVDQGDQIGLVGHSGNARLTPPHLHLGISVGGTGFSESTAVNPYPLLTGTLPGGPHPPTASSPRQAATRPATPSTANPTTSTTHQPPAPTSAPSTTTPSTWSVPPSTTVTTAPPHSTTTTAPPSTAPWSSATSSPATSATWA